LVKEHEGATIGNGFTVRSYAALARRSLGDRAADSGREIGPRDPVTIHRDHRLDDLHGAKLPRPGQEAVDARDRTTAGEKTDEIEWRRLNAHVNVTRPRG
jgi:hypothetical protein